MRALVPFFDKLILSEIIIYLTNGHHNDKCNGSKFRNGVKNVQLAACRTNGNQQTVDYKPGILYNKIC